MAKQVQWRKGTTAQHTTFVGASGEVTVDTTKNALVVHDGVTLGGSAQATEKYVNQAIATVDITQHVEVVKRPIILQPENNAIDFNGNIVISDYVYSNTFRGDLDYFKIEIATDEEFTNIVRTIDNSLSLVQPIPRLAPLTKHYIRAFFGSDNHLSRPSQVVTFTTSDATIITPIVTSPLNNTTIGGRKVTIVTNDYSTFGHTEPQVSASWKIATDPDLINIVQESLLDTNNLTSFTSNDLDISTTYYVGVKKESEFYSSNYSAIVKFATPDVTIATPVITSPVNNITINGRKVTITTNDYEPIGHSEPQLSASWKIARDPGLTDIVQESLLDTQNLSSFTSNDLDISSTYYIGVKKESKTYSSNYSAVVKFVTPNVSIAAPVITSPVNNSELVGLTLTITTDSYDPIGHTEPQISASAQLANDSLFADIVQEKFLDTQNLSTITFTGLNPSKTYYARVKKESSNYESPYSSVLTITTPDAFIYKPTIISPINGANNIGKNVIITTDAYAAVNHNEPQLSASIQIAYDPMFTNIVEESLLNTQNLTSFKSKNLSTSTTYYARFRKESKNFQSLYSDVISFQTKAVFASTYGLQWNEVNDTYLRLGDAAGIPLSTVNNAFFNSDTAVHSTMKRCVLNANGTVNYYLDPTDSTKKADGTASNLTGADGNVMVQIAKFYCKYINTSGAKQMWVSLAPQDGFVVHPAFIKNGVEVDYRYYRAYKGSTSGGKLISRSGVAATGSKTIAAFRTEAQANGTGWGLLDWNLIFAVQTLCFIEIGTFNSQAVLGNGNDTGSDYGMTTGGSNSIGNASTVSPRNDTWMSYRGIENFYADIFEWIDGINISERVVYTSNTQSSFASDVFTGAYTTTGVTLPSTNGYIKDMNFSTRGFIPTVSGGTDSTFVPDYVNSIAGTRVAAFGGYAGPGLVCGAAYLYAIDASSYAKANFGAGISF